MGSVVAPVLVALTVALVVLALSALASAGRPAREVLADGRDALRGGLTRERWVATGDTGERQAPALLLADPADDDEASVADLFDVGRPDPDGYVRAERLANVLEKAQGVVVGGVQHVQHRVRR